MTLMKLRERPPSAPYLLALGVALFGSNIPLRAQLLGHARMKESSPEGDLEAVMNRHWPRRRNRSRGCAGWALHRTLSQAFQRGPPAG
jgi:hypothetical protein